MYHKIIISISLLITLLLSACSDTPVKRYFPPQVNLQQLQRLENGQWQAHVRIQSFSTGAVTYKDLALNVQIQDFEPISVSPMAPIQIGPSNAEIITVNLSIPLNIQNVLTERSSKSQPIRYILNGQLESVDPKKTYPIDYQGRLNPTPGLKNVFR
jgi:hypothetical protein